MKKLILSIILVCFFAIPAYAFNPLVVCGGGVAASGPLCSSGTADVSETNQDTSSSFSNNAKGSGFKVVTDNSYLYSITVRLSALGSRTVTMRWGTSADLSGYIGTKSVPNVQAEADYEFVFADTVNQLDSGTTYYFGVIASDTTSIYRKNAGNPYANGSYLYANGADWDLDAEAADSDLYFIIDICAD